MATIFNFDDLITPATADEVKTTIYTVLGIVGVSTTTWKPGAVVRTIIAAVAVVIAACTVLIGNIARAGFRTLSTGSWLTAVAYFVYGVSRTDATHATGPALLSNSSGNTYNLSPYDLTVSNSATGKQYRNTTAVTLNPATSDVDVTLEAVEAGAASSAVPAAIDTVDTALDGVTVTNNAAIIGLDDQSDALLDQECSDKLGSLSPNGPPDAYRYAAVNALDTDGVPVGVTRVRSYTTGDGYVDYYVASALTGISGTQDNPATDLGAVHAAVLATATPLGITPLAHSASMTSLNIVYTAHVFSTVADTPAALRDAIDAALSSFLSTYPIGGISTAPISSQLRAVDLQAVIGAVRAEIFHVDVTIPAAYPDTYYTLAADEALILGTATGTISMYAPPTQ